MIDDLTLAYRHLESGEPPPGWLRDRNLKTREELLNDFVTTLIDAMKQAMNQFGIPPDKTEAVATHLEQFIRRSLSGDKVYIPSGRRTSIERRNHEIRQVFNGRNHDALCRRFGISKSTLYRILRKPTNAPGRR